MSLPAVLGYRAEAACLLLNQTLGLHRIQATRMGFAAAHTRLSPPAFDGVQVQRQAAFLRMISITEAFCVDRLLELAEADVSPAGNGIRNLIWEKASTSAVSTWTNIIDSYKSWYDIKPSWTNLNELLEVRNAIAHGLGKLTRTQLTKRRTTIEKLDRAQIKLVDDRIVLEEVNLLKVKDVCLDLIASIDGLIQTKTGDYS